MKILIVTGMTLPEVTDEELAEIYVASGEGDIVVGKRPTKRSSTGPTPRSRWGRSTGRPS